MEEIKTQTGTVAILIHSHKYLVISHFHRIFPLKKNHFLYLDWLITRDFYVHLQQEP